MEGSIVRREVGERIRALREERHMTRATLAAQMGITLNHLYRIETGWRNPTFAIIEKAADAFGIPISALVEPEDQLPPLPPGAFPVGELVPIPIVGTIRAGEPILAAQNIEGYCPVTADEVASGEHFFLRVRGDSMAGARIQDGDLVLVRRQADVDDGDIAVVLVNDEEATIKRVYREGGKWLLKPENPNMRPLVMDKQDVRIIGKVIQLRVQLG